MFIVEHLKNDSSQPVERAGPFELLSEARMALLRRYRQPPDLVVGTDTLRIVKGDGTEIERIEAGAIF